MPTYSYDALRADGTKTGGAREAPTLEAAAEALRADSLFILRIEESEAGGGAGAAAPPRRGPGAARFLGFLRPTAGADRVQFFRQMCLMLRSGMPLLHDLEVFGGNCPNSRLAAAVDRIADRVRNGSSFSAALGREPRLFPPLVVKMVATGEATGEMDAILERVADHLEHRAEIRGTLLTSLTYPMLLVVVTAGVVAFLVTTVIPKFMRMLESRNIAMPAVTQTLMDATDFLNAHGLGILLGVAACALLLFAASRTEQGRYGIDRFLLSIPVVGGILTLAFLAQFGRTLAVMVKSGVPLVDGVRLLSESLPNRAFSRRLAEAGGAVLKGVSLSRGLESRLIPPMLTELVKVGELSGTLDTVLEDAGVFYEKRLQRRIKWMASLFEPALILIIGGIVGFVYISFFSVLYQMSTR